MPVGEETARPPAVRERPVLSSVQRSAGPAGIASTAMAAATRPRLLLPTEAAQQEAAHVLLANEPEREHAPDHQCPHGARAQSAINRMPQRGRQSRNGDFATTRARREGTSPLANPWCRSLR